MNTFRTRRPLLVNATQCIHPTTILTDSGQRKAYPGDWIIEEENQRYIVDNTFFQRTFAPIPWTPSSEGRHYVVSRSSSLEHQPQPESPGPSPPGKEEKCSVLWHCPSYKNLRPLRSRPR